ncbi:MAG: hypothetical protein JWM91_4974 [Rhodospirillales bacterium]|nr:hypothetical protein [Rhodospirillales bacterium]
MKSVGFGLKAAVGITGIIFGLSAGSAAAGTISATTYTMPNGTTTVQIYDGVRAPESFGPGSTTVTAGQINLQTSIGILQTYCVDLFDYISPATNYTFNQNALTTASQYSNGSINKNFTAAQVSTLTRLLTNAALQTQSLVNTTALQIAIWEVEYDTALSTGAYNLDATAPMDFYFTRTGDSNSLAAMNQAQAYLNAATGYQNDSTWVAATWLSDSTHYVGYLTAVGVQNLIYLATPEPSTAAIFGLGVIGLWPARRRQMI